MRVLVACEFSGVVREAFARRGHTAYSCDLLPSETPCGERAGHLVVDVGGVLKGFLGEPWDLMIAHPPCTYLCSSGLHWNKRVPGRAAKTEEALAFVKMLLDAPIKHIALENPVGCISTRIRKYDQKIQPWMFGHDASKGTCLWLKNLPKLEPTTIVPPNGWSDVVYADQLGTCNMCGEPWCDYHDMHYHECDCIGPTQDDATYKRIDGVEFATLHKPAPRPLWGNQTPSGQNKLGPSDDRWKLRSITYQGIADAMADQWSNLD